jgi:hypothetical protein
VNALNPLNPTAAEDADLAPGPAFPVGTNVVWTYLVSSLSGVPLTNISVTDDGGTPNNPGDDFAPIRVSGDANGNGMLDPAEVWLYSSATVRNYQVQRDQYVNVARVTTSGQSGTGFAQDVAYHFGNFASISIQKALNAANHPFFPNPNMTVTTAQSINSTGFGQISASTMNNYARRFQVSLRFLF